MPRGEVRHRRLLEHRPDGHPDALDQPGLVQGPELLFEESERDALGLGDLPGGHQPRAHAHAQLDHRSERVLGRLGAPEHGRHPGLSPTPIVSHTRAPAHRSGHRGRRRFAPPGPGIIRGMPTSADPWEWFSRRTFHHSRYADTEALVAAKDERRLTVSVCLPTRNEADTVGAIVRSIREELVERVPLVDEVAVIDSASTDGTQLVAAEAGAVVHQDADILPALDPLGGKGDAMWKSLFVLKGDLICFIDADIRAFDAHFVRGLLGPLLVEDGVRFTKAFYERPIQEGARLAPTGGGRVTELTARPLVNLFFPELAPLIQPLSGECAADRALLEAVPFLTGYGVDLGLV